MPLWIWVRPGVGGYPIKNTLRPTTAAVETKTAYGQDDSSGQPVTRGLRPTGLNLSTDRQKDTDDGDSQGNESVQAHAGSLPTSGPRVTSLGA